MILSKKYLKVPHYNFMDYYLRSSNVASFSTLLHFLLLLSFKSKYFTLLTLYFWKPILLTSFSVK